MKDNPFTGYPTPQEIQAKVDEIFARNRALFGHDAYRMEGGDDPANEPDDDPKDEPTQEDGDDPKDDEPDASDTFDADRALEKIRKLNSENKNLREAKKAAEEKAAGAGEKDTRIKALEAENLRIRIGARHGLPDALIDRLKGDTEEEVLADAEQLLAVVAGKKPPTQKPKERPRGGTDPAEEPEETDPRKLAAMIPRR